jgi:hypothetical protein
MGMRARVLDDVAIPCSGATADTPSGSTHSCGIAGIAANAYDALIQIAFECAPEPSSKAATSKEQAMSRKPYSLSKQLVVAAALALGTSGVALADDSSMSPFTGDSYKYFNGGTNSGNPGQSNRPVVSNAPAAPSWRQSHPNGLTDHELQALSSSGLAASAPEFNPPMFASAPADPSWRQSHPNGLTERELQELSSSTLAVWQAPNGSATTATASANEAIVAQTPSKETFPARLARFFHPEGAPAGTPW